MDVKRSRLTRPADCHPDKPHEALGLCHSCYERDRAAQRAVREGRIPGVCGHPKGRSPSKCHPDRANRGRGLCAPCYQRERYEMSGEKHQPTDEQKLRSHLRKYDLTLEDYQGYLTRQNGVCALCGNPPPEGRRLAVDHDHETGYVRGLLCQRCNGGLGALGDNVSGLQRALAYLGGREQDQAVVKGKVPLVGKDIVLVDFDNTLYPFGELFGYAKPMIGAKTAIRMLKDQGFRIVIFTSRLSRTWHRSEGWDTRVASKEQREYIGSVLERDGIPFDDITAEKMPSVLILDDKAMRVNKRRGPLTAVKDFLAMGDMAV